MTAASWSVNRLAAQAVARYATSPTDCRQLLDALGLLTVDGAIAEDDTKDYGTLTDVSKAPGAKDANPMTPRAFADHGRRPEGMTTPDGLATLTPINEQPAAKKPRPSVPAVIRAPKPNEPVAKCGTYSGYFRHRRQHTTTCEPCKLAARDYRRNYMRRYRAQEESA